MVKNLSAHAEDARDVGLIPRLGGGNSNLLQYSCLENSMDRGAWRATVQTLQRVRHNRESTNEWKWTKLGPLDTGIWVDRAVKREVRSWEQDVSWALPNPFRVTLLWVCGGSLGGSLISQMRTLGPDKQWACPEPHSSCWAGYSPGAFVHTLQLCIRSPTTLVDLQPDTKL